MTHSAVLLASAALLAVAAPFPAPAQQMPAKPLPANALTVEAIYAHGPLTGRPPQGLTWSPNGKHLTYLDGGELIDLDPATAKSHILVSRAKVAALSGAAGTDIDADHRDRYKMASYLWAPDSMHLLFDSGGRLWLYDLANGTGVQVGFTGAASGDDPKFSPNGEMLSFIRDHGLYVLKIKDSGMLPPTFVAPPPTIATLNGEVDWVYEEEMEVRSNYFWSPDSRALAYLQMNEEAVPQYPIVDWIPTHAAVNQQRFPQPGDSNPDVRVGVVGAGGGKTLWIKLPIKPGQDYIPRFGWADRRTLWIEVITRDHKHRQLYLADAGSGQARLALEIKDDKFVDDNYDVTVAAGSIVLTNWTDGHNHIYLYSFDPANPLAAPAKLVRQLTRGDFEVGEVSTVDPVAGIVQYASNEGSPTEGLSPPAQSPGAQSPAAQSPGAQSLDQQLWQVTFAGDRHPLTTAPGTHDGNFAPAGAAFVDTHSTLMEPPTLSLCQSAGKCNPFWKPNSVAALNLRAPEQLEVKAKDGSTLYGTLLLPEGAAALGSVPLIVNPYGGPAIQTVANRWGGEGLLFDELLAQHGFAVLHADNHGAAGHGRDFAQAVYHNFGPIQLEDQLTVLDAVLAKYPQLDPNRLGWWGWSWGGTFTLYALSHSDRFRTGVAVAPVTDWRNYDTIYTERYLSQLVEFPQGYKDFSVVNSAANLKGRLLIAQGTSDDNVHIANTIQYIQKLIDAQVPYDLQLFPRKTHSIAGPDVRTMLFNRILAQFETYLKPPAP